MSRPEKRLAYARGTLNMERWEKKWCARNRRYGQLYVRGHLGWWRYIKRHCVRVERSAWKDITKEWEKEY